MNKFIAYCGIDCEKCEAHIATVNNDNALREKVAKQWSELNQVEITPQMINCVGCKFDGSKTIFCDSICRIRPCAVENKFETCGSCSQMETCQKLAMITGDNKEAYNNLIAKK